MNHNLLWAIVMLICMAICEVEFFVSNFDLTFVAFMIVFAGFAFYDLCKYSEELNREVRMNEFIQEV